jgi:hypothetical protein
MFVKEFAQFTFGYGAHKPVYGLTVFKQHAGGDAFDAEGGGQLLLLVRVNFDQLEATPIGNLHLLQEGPQSFARTTPRGPKIDQNGGGHGGRNDFGFKCFYGDINHIYQTYGLNLKIQGFG